MVSPMRVHAPRSQLINDSPKCSLTRRARDGLVRERGIMSRREQTITVRVITSGPEEPVEHLLQALGNAEDVVEHSIDWRRTKHAVQLPDE